MAARLAPGEPEPGSSAAGSRRAGAERSSQSWGLALLKGRAPTPQEFNELADAASTDSLVAGRFALGAERSCEATTPAPPRSRPLLPSRNNHDRFAAVARGNPQLEAALPISADIAALTEIGLDAVAAIESERAPAMVEWCRPT